MKTNVALVLVLACVVLAAGCKSEEAVTTGAAPSSAPGKTADATGPATNEQTPMAGKSDELTVNPNAKATKPGSGL